MYSPDKHIRKYFFDALKSQASVFDANAVDEKQTLYFVFSNQTKQILTENKCYDSWNCNITIEVIQRSLGTSNKGSRVVINDLENFVLTAYQNANITGYSLINKEYESNSLVTQGLNEVIDRIVININLKLK